MKVEETHCKERENGKVGKYTWDMQIWTPWKNAYKSFPSYFPYCLRMTKSPDFVLKRMLHWKMERRPPKKRTTNKKEHAPIFEVQSEN